MKRALASLVILPLIMSCGHGHEPDFTSKNGVNVWLHSDKAKYYTQESTTSLENVLLDKISTYKHWDRDKIRRTLFMSNIEIIDNQFKCAYSSQYVMCDGEAQDRNAVVVALGCIYSDSYAHELTHIISYEHSGNVDGLHMDKDLWQAPYETATENNCKE